MQFIFWEIIWLNLRWKCLKWSSYNNRSHVKFCNGLLNELHEALFFLHQYLGYPHTWVLRTSCTASLTTSRDGVLLKRQRGGRKIVKKQKKNNCWLSIWHGGGRDANLGDTRVALLGVDRDDMEPWDFAGVARADFEGVEFWDLPDMVRGKRPISCAYRNGRRHITAWKFFSNVW